MASSLPPETPTRALLKRLHRRSSVLPTSSSSNCLDQSPSLLGPPTEHSAPPADRVGDSTEQDDSDDTHCADDVPAGNRSIITIEESTLSQQDSRIRQLQWQVEELQMQKQEVEAELRKSKKKAREGVTWDTARKLEREFEAQEMILKGLQRDNERRTIESERLHRKLRTMSDFLQQHHGDGWHGLVFGGRIDKTSLECGPSPLSQRAQGSRLTEVSSSDQASASANMSTASLSSGPLPGQWLSPAQTQSKTELSRDSLSVMGTPEAPQPRSTLQSASTEEGNMTAIDASRWADAEASFDTTYADCSHTTSGNTNTGDASEEASHNDSTQCLLASERERPTIEESVDEIEALQRPTKAAVPAKDQEIQDISQILAAASLQEPSQPSIQQSHETPSRRASLHQHQALRAQLEETRLLLEGFARRSARREMELIEMQERARNDLERGREALEGVAERILCVGPP
ncbi:hypothetical protein BCV69DRAFT_313957 [Microstroma glucosiphilum]|uniref:Uncharacterized protein n=1 Tax=Pseudomicrostroma glucosiphilum TaxID=1684307 RepID=A0A316U1X4_9BASI|nr:hypothetical protein BCV69DRAFT_313957 [Pseudomicrostroma glucosiphilum]PWN19210.1 hypothetical protein BCV69DRAFT_313957 [Pseudomicrostroma glucosiphilum]